MEIVKIKVADLEGNIGQVPDLPMNPRQWRKEDVDGLAASLTETPELFEARPLLVYPFGKKFVILGGNLRFEAAKSLGWKECPAIVFPEATGLDKLKEIVIKDNGAFGAWDYDALANEWGDLPLSEWGIPVWDSTKEEEQEVIPDISDKIEAEFKLEIDCEDEKMQQTLFDELTERGYKCKVLTL